MAATMERTSPHAVPYAPGRWLAFLLAAALPLFLGAVLGDWAYWASYEIQWSNFASWLVAGGMVFLGIALACALVDLFRADRRGGRSLMLFVWLLVAFVLGFIDALVHARDAWAVMPTGLALSVVVLLLVAVATAMVFAGLRIGARP